MKAKIIIQLKSGFALLALLQSSIGAFSSGPPPAPGPSVSLLVSGLDGGSGSTVGPGGALYVTEGKAGRVSRVAPQTGEVSTFATGLPAAFVPRAGFNPDGGTLGGAMDIAFIGHTAYVLVTLVGSDIGGSDIVGIYRVDGPDSFTVIADIGAFSLANPPIPALFVPTGVQYALETYRGGFLVTDGHHNRVLRVELNGAISEIMTFGNIVPTGIATSGNTIYIAEAGPVPHAPANGKVVAFSPKSNTATEIGSGASLLVDVEFGRGRDLFALSQGDYAVGDPEGSAAAPNTGALVAVNPNGTFTVIVDGLDRPTSVEIIGNTAYVVTLLGDIWKIADVSGPPYGRSH